MNILAATSSHVPSDMWPQARCESACTFAQSDQNPHLVHFGQPKMQGFFVQTTNTHVCADARVNLSPRWEHMSEGVFCYFVALLWHVVWYRSCSNPTFSCCSLLFLSFFLICAANNYVQSTLVISTSLISNSRLYRSEILVPVLTWQSKNR